MKVLRESAASYVVDDVPVGSHRLLISEPPLQVLPSLAVKLGLGEAIMLQQIHYWLGRSSNVRDGRRWVYNTAVEWQEQFPFWSVSTVRRILASLRAQGVLVATDSYNAMKIDTTLWYSIDYSAIADFDKRVTQIDQSDSPSWVNAIDQFGDTNNQRLPETTTEITTTTPPSPSLASLVSVQGESAAVSRTATAVARKSTALPESVEVWCRLTGKVPNATQSDLIAYAVTDVRKWEDVLVRWLGNGYKWQSVEKQLSVYREGWNDSRKGATNGKGRIEGVADRIVVDGKLYPRHLKPHQYAGYDAIRDEYGE
jgi:hypothetical protein